MTILIVKAEGRSCLPSELTMQIVIESCANHTFQLKILPLEERCDYAAGAQQWIFELSGAMIIQFPVLIGCAGLDCMLNVDYIVDQNPENAIGSVDNISAAAELTDIDEVVLEVKSDELDWNEFQNVSEELPVHADVPTIPTFPRRPQDYFLGSELVLTCEILVLRIKHYIEGLNTEAEGDDNKICEVVTDLFDKLITRIKVETVVAVQGKFCAKSVTTTKSDFEKFVESWKRDPSKKRTNEITKKKVLSKVKEWLKIVRVVDIGLLLEYLHDSMENAKKLAGKDVVFVVGATGVGKSTLIHFLTRTVFTVERTYDGVKLSIAQTSTVCDVESVETSDSYTSMTRYINPVLLSCEALTQLGVANASVPIMLVDSPGFEDTNGPEVDISNSFGIVQAATACDRVKLLFVCDNQVGSKGQNFKESIKTLIRMLGDDVESYSEAITWVFTKFNREDAVMEEIEKLVESCEDDHNPAFTEVISALQSSAEAPLMVRPDADDPAKILQVVAACKAIENPGTRFRTFFSKDSEAKLRKQMRIHEDTIKTALELNELRVIVSKLKELRDLNRVIGVPEGIRCEETVVSFLTTHILRLIKDYNDFLTQLMRSSEPISDADKAEFCCVCDRLVMLSPLGDLLEMSDFLDSNFLKVAQHSNRLFSEFSVFFKEQNEDSLLELVRSVKPLEIHIQSVSRILKRMMELEGLSRSSDSIVQHKGGEIVTSLQEYIAKAVIILKDFLDHIQTVVFNWQEPFRLDNFALIVEVLGFIKRFVSGFDEHLGALGSQCVDTLFARFLDFESRTSKIRTALQISNFSPAELGEIVSTYNHLVGLSNTQNIGFVVDLPKHLASMNDLAELLRSLADSLYHRLLNFIPSELSTISVDYDAIANAALLFNEMSEFVHPSTRWEDRMRAHINQCRDAIATGLRDIMSGSGDGVNYSHIAVAVSGLFKSGASLDALESVGISMIAIGFLRREVNEFLAEFEVQLAALPCPLEAGTTALSTIDILQYHKLAVICYQCNLLVSCFQNYNLLENNALLQGFRSDLLHHIDAFETSTSSHFVTRFRLMVAIESYAQRFTKEVYHICRLIDTLNELGRLINVSDALETSLKRKCEQYQLETEERVHGAFAALMAVCEYHELPNTEEYLKSVRIIVDVLHGLESMLAGYNQLTQSNGIPTTCSSSASETVAAMAIFAKLYKEFPEKLLNHYLCDNGMLMTLYSSANRAAEEAINSNSYPEMKCLSTSLRAIVQLDPLIQNSDRNSFNPFTGFQSLGKSVFDHMNRVVSDAKNMIMVSLTQFRFEHAAEKLDQHKNRMSGDEKEQLLDAVTAVGKSVALQLENLVRQLSSDRFSFDNYFRLQEEVVKLIGYRNACEALSWNQQEANQMLSAGSHNVQLYFVKGVEACVKELCDAHSIYELERFMLQLTKMQPNIVNMMNETKLKTECQQFSQLVVMLTENWRGQADALRDELFDRMLDLRVDQYPSHSPKALLQTLLQCSTMLAEDSVASSCYKEFHDILVAGITDKLKDLLNPSIGESTVSYFKYSERLKYVNDAKPYLTLEIVGKVQSQLSEASEIAQQMKLKLEQERSRFLDCDNISAHITLLERVIMQREFRCALEYKTTILRTLRECYHQYKALIHRGNLLEGLELAARALVPTCRVIETIKKCREPLSKPSIVHYPLMKDHTVVRRDKYYYVENGVKVHIPRSVVTEQMKMSRSYKIQRPSEVMNNPDVFSDEELTRATGDILLLLSQKLNDSLRYLESVTVERLDKTPQQVAILLKLLELRSISPTGYAEAVVPAMTGIRTAVANFHGRLMEMVGLCKTAFEEGQVASIRSLLDTAKIIEPTVINWEGFVDSCRLQNDFTFPEETDLSSIRYTQLQRQLDTSIGEWISLLKAERFLYSSETTTRINADRDAFYRKVNMNLQCISLLNEIIHHSNRNNGNIAELTKECVEHIGQQIIAISNELCQLNAQIPSESDEIYINCCNTYDNLRSIAANIERATIRQQALKATVEINELFKKKFRELYHEIESIVVVPKESITQSHIDSCIDKLVQFKRMSNRLVCFSAEIDALIDQLTDSLQQGDYGAERFGRIAINLQARLERDFGEHIRSLLQHRAFDEITNILRMRRTKWFTIYHVLGFRTPAPEEAHDNLVDDHNVTRVQIESEDIGHQTRINLYYHWREFDTLYWNLVLPGLKDESPLRQMAHIVETVNLTVLQEAYLTDQLRYRCLMSYVFAYWTLSRYAGNRCFSITISSPVRINSGNNSSSSAEDAEAGNISADLDYNNNTSSATASAPLTTATEYLQHSSLDHLVQPHPAQVVALFRLLGIEGKDYDAAAPIPPKPQASDESFLQRSASLIRDLLSTDRSDDSKFPRHLVEIPTGEGKSVVLAVLATLMALLGYTVHCACYSAYLSKRDQDHFRHLFNGFAVSQFIEYGTFGSLCEKILDADGNIRMMVQSMLGCDCMHYQQIDRSNISIRPRLLLIDEVDVFFNRDYYGRLYEPFAAINKPSLANMAKWLWRNRRTPNSNGNATWRNVIASKEFKECMIEFGAHKDLAEEMIKGMLLDLKTVTSPTFVKDYTVTEVNGTKMIAYKEQDGLNHNIIKGYQTMFHYLKEFDEKQISEMTLNRALVGRIYCGGYSYAEIPLLYNALMGVTGTLRQVRHGPQSSLLAKYRIQKFTYIPSVYGKSKRTFRENDPRDVRIVENASYFPTIVEEIETRIGRAPDYKRAVLVFFENVDQLDAFKASPSFVLYRQQALVINETTTASEKDGKIRAAATTGQIVLLTKAMGRGTDFICYDEKLLDSGGVHVLQTFLSEQNTEEVQIMGRTGRQGNNGSYCLVLKIEDLQKFGLSVPTVRESISKGLYYQPLSNARDAYFRERIYPQLEHGIKGIEKLFQESKNFTKNLRANKISDAKRYLMAYNRVEMPKSTGVRYRIMVLMDATGSMEPFLLLAQNTVKEMFQRLNHFIPAHGIEADVSVQYVAYRNYNAPPEKLLEVSPWEPLSDNPARLFEFMDGIEADFGLGNEAVEVAFSHVLDEDRLERVNAVILVGDMPPNTRVEVPLKREERRQGWMFTRFRSAVYYEDEMKRFRHDMPVHCFYLDNEAATAFNAIALKTKGSSQPLDVKAADAAEKLSACVSMHINRAVGGQQLVDLFRRTYNVPQGYIG